MFLIVFGAPGVGKSTQAKILCKKFSIPHISTGEILRESAKNIKSIGIKSSQVIANGEFVSDEVAILLLKGALIEKNCQNGAILDGFPRTVEQAKELDIILEELNYQDVVVLNLIATEDEIVKRLVLRRTCRDCHSIFNLAQTEGMLACPNCSAENSLYQRPEDDEKGIRVRQKIFSEITLPILDYYSNSKKIAPINSLQSIEGVTREILMRIV